MFKISHSRSEEELVLFERAQQEMSFRMNLWQPWLQILTYCRKPMVPTGSSQSNLTHFLLQIYSVRRVCSGNTKGKIPKYIIWLSQHTNCVIQKGSLLDNWTSGGSRENKCSRVVGNSSLSLGDEKQQLSSTRQKTPYKCSLRLKIHPERNPGLICHEVEGCAEMNS